MSKEDALGEIAARCMNKYAVGEIPHHSHPKFPLSIGLKMLKMIVIGKIIKSYNPNPFFDQFSGKPIVEPTLADRNKF